MANPVQSNVGVPDPQNVLVNIDRSVAPVWFKFFVALQNAINGPGNPFRRDLSTGTASPAVGSVSTKGILIASGGTVEFSRDGGTSWYTAYTQNSSQTGGGALPMRAGDMYRVSWTGATPTISFFSDI